jgi:hypothetical protein
MTLTAVRASLDDYNGHYSACLDGHRQARSATPGKHLDEVDAAALEPTAVRNAASLRTRCA